MRQIIESEIRDSIMVKVKVLNQLVPKIEEAAQIILEALKNKKKVLIFGNGGSAADAQHIAAEFINRFMKDRSPLPAVALTTDSSILTSAGNDFGFDSIFEKQVVGLANNGDVLIGISTSGNSENVLKAINAGKSIGTKSIGLLGCDGGRIAKEVNINITVPSNITPRIQESHITIAHIICGLVERKFFE